MPSARCAAPADVIPQEPRRRVLRLLLAASTLLSTSAPLSPILLSDRSSEVGDGLMPTPSARCAAPAAVIPQSTRCRVVRVLLAASTLLSTSAPLSPILLPRSSSVARDVLLLKPSARCAAPAAVMPQYPRRRVVSVLLAASAQPSPSAPLSPILLKRKSSVAMPTPRGRRRRPGTGP